jgi:hypothetical protein
MRDFLRAGMEELSRRGFAGHHRRGHEERPGSAFSHLIVAFERVVYTLYT